MFTGNQYTHTKEESQRQSGKICEQMFEDWCSYHELLTHFVDEHTHDFVMCDKTRIDVKARNWFIDDQKAKWWIQVRQVQMQTAQVYVFYLYDRNTRKGVFCGALGKDTLCQCDIVKDGDPLPTKNMTMAKGDCYIIDRQMLALPLEFLDHFYEKQRIILRENTDVKN